MNFQNIPRSDKAIKRAFVPKLDAFLLCDYMQIELRLLAFYMASCGDDSMAEVIRQGRDLHTASAQGIFDKIEVDEEERQIAKICNFLMVYGGGTPALTKTLGISYLEARSILRAFHKTWPGIESVQENIAYRIEERGYVTTLWGRHLHPESPHKALNALVQGCAADLMKAALVKVHRFLTERDPDGRRFTSHLVSSVHDELILDCVESEIPALAELLPDLMDHPPVSAVVPIGVDVEYSRTSWADKAPYFNEELKAA